MIFSHGVKLRFNLILRDRGYSLPPNVYFSLFSLAVRSAFLVVSLKDHEALRSLLQSVSLTLGLSFTYWRVSTVLCKTWRKCLCWHWGLATLAEQPLQTKRRRVRPERQEDGERGGAWVNGDRREPPCSWAPGFLYRTQTVTSFLGFSVPWS